MSVLEDIKSAWNIDFSINNKPKVESQHQKFTESLKPEQSNSEDEYRELLTGSKDKNVKPTINVESDKSSIKQENYKELEDEYTMYILKQIDNVLRGDELRVREDNKESPENKKIHLEVIKRIKKHVKDYDGNIQQAKEYNERMEDDLR